MRLPQRATSDRAIAPVVIRLQSLAALETAGNDRRELSSRQHSVRCHRESFGAINGSLRLSAATMAMTVSAARSAQRPPSRSKPVIAGPGVAICSDCLALCNEILVAKRGAPDDGPRGPDDGPRAQ